MPPQALTVIAKIKPGQVAPLKAFLSEIGHDIMNNPHIQFPKGMRTHFARLVILPDDMPTPCDLEPHLLFSSNYDGPLDHYLREIISVSPGWDFIWSHCEGYTGLDDFPEFARRHHHEPNAFYVAFKDETVHSIRTYKAVREKFEAVMDDRRLREFVNAVMTIPPRQPGPLEKISAFPRQIAAAVWETLFEMATRFVKQVLFPENLQINPYSAIENQLNRSMETIEHVQELADFEDFVVQNQMNILSEIKPGETESLRQTLAAVALAAQLSPPGQLAGIATIHFARWVIFDNGRRLLFMSNYDGTWENYIGDFVRDVSGGMNAIWKHTVGFPPGGPPDIAAFEEHIRMHQIRSLVFYSAYPDTTVQNILDDRNIGRMLNDTINRQGVVEALRRL